MWSLATMDMYDDFEITFYETKADAIQDIESIVDTFSENTFDENAPTIEEFVQSIKDDSTSIGFHWRTDHNEFINLEFHDDIQKKVV